MEEKDNKVELLRLILLQAPVFVEEDGKRVGKYLYNGKYKTLQEISLELTGEELEFDKLLDLYR